MKANTRDARLERFPDTHAPCPTVPSPGEVRPKIDVIFPTEFISRPAAHVGQEVIISKEYLARAWDHFPYAGESGKANAIRQSQAIFDLCPEHVAVEVLAGCITPQFVARAINAISVKGRLAAGRAPKQIIGEDLILAQTIVLVKSESVRLKGVFAAQSLGKEVGREYEVSSTGRIEPVEACIACHLCADGR